MCLEYHERHFSGPSNRNKENKPRRSMARKMDLSMLETDNAQPVRIRAAPPCDSLTDVLGELRIHPVETIKQKVDTDARAGDFRLRGELDRIKNQIFTQNEDGDTYLHECIIFEQLQQIEAILKITIATESTQLLNIQNKKYQTPLHLAVILRQPEIVNLLVRCGASLDVRDDEGNTALHIACEHGYVEMIHLLADGNVTGIFNLAGQDCTYTAARTGDLDIAQYLVEQYGHINTQEQYGGKTLLHLAIKTGQEELLKYLLSHSGIDLNRKDRNGHKAIRLLLDDNCQAAYDLVAQMRPDLIELAYDELSGDEE